MQRRHLDDVIDPTVPVQHTRVLAMHAYGERFLVDRTNGRSYATVLRLSSVCLWRYVLWLNGAS